MSVETGRNKNNMVPTSALKNISLLKQDGASTDSEEEQADSSWRVTNCRL